MNTAIELFVLGAAFSFGPCALTCEWMLLPCVAGTSGGWRPALRAVLTFTVTRLAAICLLAGMMGAAGAALADRLSRHERLLFCVGGGLICLLGVLIALGYRGRRPVKAVLQRLPGRGTLKAPALLGFVVGLLPCLPFVTVMLLIAAQAHSFAGGLALGLAFGLGKSVSPMLPLGVAMGLAPERLIKGLSGRVLFERLGGAVLFLAGLNLIAARIFEA